MIDILVFPGDGPKVCRRWVYELIRQSLHVKAHNCLSEICDRSSEDQRYRAGGLNLVVATIILRNIVSPAEAIETLKNQGVEVKKGYLEHLLPLGWEHINLTGDFRWNMKQIPPAGQLCPLRINKRTPPENA